MELILILVLIPTPWNLVLVRLHTMSAINRGESIYLFILGLVIVGLLALIFIMGVGVIRRSTPREWDL